MRILAIIAGLILLLVPVPRAEALRCGSDLVQEGDPAYQVERACGRPDWARIHHSHFGAHHEVWHYNFGPRKLIRVLHFREGRLQRVDSAGHGFSEPSGRGSCRPIEVKEGMTAPELLYRCGEPVQRETRRMRFHRHWAKLPHLAHHHHFETVFVDDWYYDFGSNYLPRRVRLVDGIVADIETVD